MKILLLAALIAAVSCGPLSNGVGVQNQWPWQVGKVYRYDVNFRTLSRLDEGETIGSALRARFVVRVKAPNRLLVKLEETQHAPVHELLQDGELPVNLNFQPVANIDVPFEVIVDGGRVKSLSVPTSLPLHYENVLKGLISALQVDLSAQRLVNGPQNYDKISQQGVFSKMESDVTGDCETLYTVSPVSSDWRRELPKFSNGEEPIEITKSKNYGHCHHRVAYHFGVPESAKWTGTANNAGEDQFMDRATNARLLVAKQGVIYKADIIGTVYVHPHMYGKQKAEVLSKVNLTLITFEQDSEAEWQMAEGYRFVNSLSYSMSQKRDTAEVSSSKSIETQKEAGSIKSRKQPSQSSSSSSSSDTSSTSINDELFDSNEPAYAALYMHPQPHTEKKQSPMNAQKVLQDIAQQLQNPSNISKADVLSTFNILVRIIASMTSEQLQQISRSIEVEKYSSNIVKANTWMIFRDAVTQAGTLPAFKEIQKWLQTKKITGEEAAQVVASLASTLRYPTKEVMLQFFNLAWSPEVSSQKYLNSTCLLAATKVINMAQVNNHTAQSYYPTYMYDRLIRKHDQFVIEDVLPRLREGLKKAVENGDSGRAQVFIKALGILGHRSVLDVFAPYLEGKVPVSTYLRIQMIKNLQVLASLRDHHVRAVIFSIIKNTAEPFEIRVACVQNIFCGRPTAAMMQDMARMTHVDPSIEVRSALKSGIEKVSELKSPRYFDLSRSAQAVRPMLSKETFDNFYSSEYYIDSYNSEYEIESLGMLSYIASENSLFPKYLKMKLEQPGWNVNNKISAFVSNIPQFIESVLKGIVNGKYFNVKSVTEHKFSAEKVAEILRIKHDPQNPLEASITVNLMNQLRFFTVSIEDLTEWPKVLQEQISNLAKGINIHYTKILNQAQVSVMFPTPTGMPFIYKYKVPILVNIQGKVKGQVNLPTKENRDISLYTNNEIELTIARNIDGSVGYLDTITNQFVSAGIVSKLQLTLPVKFELTVKSGEVKINLRPIRPDQDTNVVHISVWPYTASQDKDTLTAVSLDPSFKVVTRVNKVVNVDTKLGQFSDTVFQVQGYSYSQDYKNYESFMEGRDLFSVIVEPLRQKDVAWTHFTVKYLGKQSQCQGVTLNVVYDKSYYEQQVQQQSHEISEIKDTTPNSQERRKIMLNRAVSGVNKPRAAVIDLSAQFDGPQKLEYVVTVAWAKSPVDPKVQAHVFAGRNSVKNGNNQFNGYFTFTVPTVPSLNFLDLIKTDLKSNFKGELNFDQDIKTNVKVKGFAERSVQYIEALKTDSWGKQCTEEIRQNNLVQTACIKMLTLAGLPDHIKMSVQYSDVSPGYRNITQKALKFIEYLVFWNSDNNVQKTTPGGKIEVELQNSYINNSMDVWISSPVGEIQINDVELPKVVIPAMSVTIPLPVQERVLDDVTKQQYYPFCTLDGSLVKTFSNRTYAFVPTRSWVLVMLDDAKYAGKHGWNTEQVVVLAKSPNPQQLEVYISYKSNTGKDTEITVLPSEGTASKVKIQVVTNAKKVADGDLTSYWDDVAQAPFLEYYTRPDGVLMLEIYETRLHILSDGKRLVLFSNGNRNNTVGLCGKMTGEPRDDFVTPVGVVDQPEYYSALYTLNLEGTDHQVQQLQEQGQQHVYQNENKFTKIVHPEPKGKSDREWSVSEEEETWSVENVYRTKCYKLLVGSCEVQQQIQYYENHGEICITTTPVNSCQAECRGEDYQVQNVQVVCRPKLDQQFISYRDHIRQGVSPSVVGNPKVRQFRVPNNCRA